MKKIKFLIAGLFSAIALVFACVVGTRVNAEGETTTYTFTPYDFYATAATEAYATSKKTTIDNSRLTQGKVTISSAGGHYYEKLYDSSTSSVYSTLTDSSELEIGATTYGLRMGTGTYFTFDIKNGETAELKIAAYSTGKKNIRATDSSSGIKLFVFDTASTNTSTTRDFTIQNHTSEKLDKNKLYDLTITNMDNSHNVVYFESTVGIAQMQLIVTGSAKTEDDLIDEAEAAISAIGTVTYSTTSYELINAASVAISEVSNPADSISNYSTYTDAVTTFNNLETNAISSFTTAVSNIGTVSSTSGNAISTAEDAYDVLLSSTKKNENVITAKTTLDAAKLDYADIMYDTLSKSFSTTDDNSISSSEVTLSNDEQLGNSIFTATTGMRKKTQAALTIGAESWNSRYYTNGNSTCTTDSKQRLIYFNAKTSGTLKIAATTQNNSDATRKVEVWNSSCTKIASKAAQTNVGITDYIYVNIPQAGTYYIGSYQGVNFFYLEFIPGTTLADNTTAAVFAEKNTAGDTLRFVGTLTGITDLTNIDKIELVLAKDNVVAANPIELTTCYTSVINTSKTCAEAENTYYVIFRLTGIDSLAAGTAISKQLKVTFTDGSIALSDITDITL